MTSSISELLRAEASALGFAAFGIAPADAAPETGERLRQWLAEGRHGVMPAWGKILGDTRSRLVAAYVWSLSHQAKQGAQTQQ